MKKLLSALCAMCIIASFSACAQTEPDEPITSDTDDTSASETTPTEPVTTAITSATEFSTTSETTKTEPAVSDSAEATTTMPPETEKTTDKTGDISEAFTPAYDPGMPEIWLDLKTTEIYSDTKTITLSVNTENEFITDNKVEIQMKTENGWETYRMNYGSLSYFDNIVFNKDNPLVISLNIEDFYCENYTGRTDDKLYLTRGTDYRIVKEVNGTEYYANFTVGAKNAPLKKEDIQLYMPSALIIGEQDSFEIQYTYVGEHEYAEYCFGCEYTLEILNDKGKWENVPFSENAAFIELGYIIGTESTQNSTTVYLKDEFYASPLKDGTYRVVKPMCDGITLTGLFRLNDGYPRYSPVPSEDDLKVTIREVEEGTPITTDTKSLTIDVMYTGNYDYAEFSYGTYEALEKYVDGQWQKIEYADDVAWFDVAILVGSEYKSNSDIVSLNDGFTYKEPLTAGKYRVLKEVANVTYYLEFEMADSDVEHCYELEEVPPLKKGDIKVTMPVDSKNIKNEKNAKFILNYEYVGEAENPEYVFGSSFRIEKRDPVSGEWKDFPFKKEMGFDDYIVTVNKDFPDAGETIYISEEMFKEPFLSDSEKKTAFKFAVFRIVKPLCDDVEVTAVFMLYDTNGIKTPSANDVKMSVSSFDGGEITTETEKLIVNYEYIGDDDYAEYEFISRFIIEKEENGKWVQLISEEDEWAENDYSSIGTETPHDQTTVYTQSFAGKPLEPGSYRLTQKLGYQSISAEFTVKKPEPELFDKEGEIYLTIDKITKNGYICSLNRTFPAVYTVQCNTDEYDFCTGDLIIVSYSPMYKQGDMEFLLIPSAITPYIAYDEASDYDAPVEKPVIYLYPEKKTEVSVKLDYNGELIVTYPEYNGGWSVTAMPDGTLYDENGNEYSYLFWEGVADIEYDFSKGFCVKGEDTVEFLRYALSELGLTPREYNEFIVYWLPKMQNNKYNIISFQSDCYTDSAILGVSPEPDTVIRVFMAYYPSDKPVEIKEQELSAPPRNGFTVIEWGGTNVRNP